MCEKVKNIINRCWNSKYFFGKLFLVIFIAILLITCISITVQDGWKKIFYYPEEEYCLLENAAKSMVENNDWITQYYLEINYYNNETNYISFSLRKNTVILNVTVENYQKDNQTITIGREHKNKTQKIVVTGIFMIAISCLIGFIIVVIFMILSGAIYFVMFVIEKIISIVKKE